MRVRCASGSLANANEASVTADQRVITTGSQQGIDLVGKVFLEPGDEVVVENPCYLAAIQAFSGYEASFIPIDSDDKGMRVDQIEEALKHRGRS